MFLRLAADSPLTDRTDQRNDDNWTKTLYMEKSLVVDTKNTNKKQVRNTISEDYGYGSPDPFNDPFNDPPLPPPPPPAPFV
jgi:hypothetical protein